MRANDDVTGGEPPRRNGGLDIAIIGVACRFPFAANPDEYWENIVARRNCIREVPPDRWNWRDHFGDPRQGNKTLVKWGGFIDDVDKFDPLFFGIAPNEAAFIDPQHRLFLETSWHAVEDAGYSIAALSGRRIGVYAGVSKNDYSEAMRESRYDIAPYVSTGTVHSILVNRVSFLFNLRGRSEAVDTACSSSLVALHNAIRDIASGECEAAIVGGVNALITPTMFISHSKSGMLSPDGQCRTFSAAANGYVRSEGVGVLFIRPLDAALADGDHVYAVIRSSAINHGGRSNFLTSPSTEAQAEVVMEALRRGGIDPRSIGYIEAHGTGTPLGDPIEINGLKRAFAGLRGELPQELSAGEPHCALSAVKTNVGHLESAAGMAGIIKVIMAMKHRRIAPVRELERINPYIELDGSPFYIPTETIPWESRGWPRRAGVSSFGMGGVNAHVILEEAPAVERAPIDDGREWVFPLSAKKGRLHAYAESLRNHLVRRRAIGEPFSLADVAYVLQTGRDEFEERLAIVAATADELIAALDRFIDGDAPRARNVFTGESRRGQGMIETATRSAAELAAQWVQGAKIDWPSAFTGLAPRRISLPGYPFARKRCWFTDVASRIAAAAEAGSVPEPSPVDVASRTMRVADFYIRDHVVQGKPTLPGVVHLEWARSAAAAQTGRRVQVLEDVYWLAPLIADEESVRVDVRVSSQNERTRFELLRNGTVHSRGIVSDLPPAQSGPLDLAAIRARCAPGKSNSALYVLLREHGLAYGPSFQVIDGYVLNDREILAELRLPAEGRDGEERVLHPAMMDGVFQSITALSILGSAHLERQYVPFHLEAVEIVRPTTERCFVHATTTESLGTGGGGVSFDATLCDGDGNVLVRVKRLQKRPMGGREVVDSAPSPRLSPLDIYYGPEWRRKELPQDARAGSGTLLVFADDDSILPSFRRHWGSAKIVVVLPGSTQERLGESVYRIDPSVPAHYEALFQALAAGGTMPTSVVWLWGLGIDGDDWNRALNRTVYAVLELTRAAFHARCRALSLVYLHAPGRELADAIHPMIAGFARTLKYENPKYEYGVVAIDDLSNDAIARVACAELGAVGQWGAMREVSHRGGRRHVRRIVRLEVARRNDATVLRKRGVYLISGGAGGLGSIFSRYLAEKYQATLLWLGRSPKTPAIESRMGEIERAGGRCDYFSTDITDRQSLAAAIARIKEMHPRIDGVLHAAGLIEDAFILRKQRESFARVLAPKVLGAINLDFATQDEPLDFFVVFSSIAALMPNQGQCDYAAANSFLDGFSEIRNGLVADGRRSGVTLALNWPLWASGGIRVSAEEERHLLRVFGMEPLPAEDGIEIFETSLALAAQKATAIHQIAAIDGDHEKIEHCLGLEAAEEDEDGSPVEEELKAIFANRLGVAPQTIDGRRAIGELGINSSEILAVIHAVNERFDADLKPTLLFEINTIARLASHLNAIGKDVPVARKAAGAARWDSSLIDVERSDPERRIFRRTFRTAEFYLRDHVVDGQYNMPGACYVEMARQAGDLLLGEGAVARLLHNYWAAPLSSPQEDFTAEVHLAARQDQLAYEIVSFTPEGARRVHAMGQLAREKSPGRETRIDLDQVRSRCGEVQYPGEIYAQIHGEGLIVGPTFQPMTHIFVGPEESLGFLELPDEVRSTIGDYVLHPALLTGAFQTSLIGNRRNAAASLHYIPIGMDEMEILAPIPAECCVYSRSRPANARNDEMRKFDVDICRPDGSVVVRMKGFAIRGVRAAAAAGKAIETPAEPVTAGAGERAVQELIRSKLAGPVGLPVEEIDMSVPFDQYGVTSVMVVELNQSLEEIFGPLPKTLFFEYRNIAELAQYFLENHGDVVRSLTLPSLPAVTVPASEEGDRADEVRRYLRSLIAGPIGISADEIDVHTGFDQYGINSVMVVELNEIFERIFGPLSKTLFFEYRTIDELSRYFLEEHRERLLAALPSRPAVPIPAMTRQAETSIVESVGERVEEQPSGDIAIVSAAGRFPGARTLEEFWKVLREGRDCITEIPPDRFDYRRYFDADRERNLIYGRWGGFLDDVDKFDAGFFNISPREAELIDPQERLLLEVVWEMLERGGYTRQRLRRLSGGRVGVFTGALWQPYEGIGIEATHAGNVVGPSSLLYSIANRISYFFDLNGPSMAVDTACSSSLTALHLACRSIRDGEIDFAIAAGVNLSLTASKYLFLSRYRFLSTDGRCRSYGADGDGYVPGEGVCALLLKPLSKAIADGDAILAVIKGTAANHGGRTNGYTVPSPRAQGSVIAQTLEQARVDARSITYIEGHGTGTSLGDPIEIAGLEKALGLSKERGRVCAIGSVKSNIGHLEAAAGIASVIKVILQMQNGELAPSLHAETLNPNIDFAHSAFRVQRELAPWPRGEFGRRCAGVSSFGAGGSNVHVILEEYVGPPAPALRNDGAPALFVFSARTEERLVALVRNFRAFIATVAPERLHAVAYTLQIGREAMRERLAVVARSFGELQTALQEFIDGKPQRAAWRRGRAAGGRGDSLGTADTPSTETWPAGQDPTALAEAWVDGREIDWSALYGGRHYELVPLPTYPFARERHWIDIPATAPRSQASPARRAALHPLPHRDASGSIERRYSATFTGEEFFLAQHQVQVDGRTFEKVLPAVACLEMARAAIESSWPPPAEDDVLELQNTVWAQPIIVREPVQLDIVLTPAGNDRLDYRISSRGRSGEMMHCQGRAVWSRRAEPPRLDPESIGRQLGATEIGQSSVYAAFLQTGGYYGPALQGIVSLRQSGDQLLSRLRLPDSVAQTSRDYILHPTLMDSALQGYLGLVDDWNRCSGRTRMPFALESLRVLAPCTEEMFGWMRHAPESHGRDGVVKLDVDLCDREGRVCVQMRGFGVREVRTESRNPAKPPQTTAERPGGLLTLSPLWDAAIPDVGEPKPHTGERVVVIGGDENQHRGLREQCATVEVLTVEAGATPAQIAGQLRGPRRIDHLVWILPSARTRSAADDAVLDEQERGVHFGFRLIKALLAEGYGSMELAWTIITNRSQSVRAGEAIDPAHSSVHGLVGSMAREYGIWKIRLLDLGDGAWPWAEIVRMEFDVRGDAWAWREQQWYRRRLLPCDIEEPRHSAFRRRGVYVVIGGAGGVGEVLSRYLIRQYDARIVWIGRRPPDEEIERKQSRLSAEGGERPSYIAADARNRAELERAAREIREHYGRVDGVIHSAIVLADRSLANMDEAGFRAALSTKVDSAVHLAQVFGRERLDFILYFSSLMSFLKAAGQSNYAAGCTFTDAFAQWQSAAAGYPVKVMNWGYWAGVGIVAAAEYQERMARMDWGSLEPDEAMAGLERLMSGPLSQMGMVRATGARAAETLGVDNSETIWTAREQATLVTVPSETVDGPAASGIEQLETRRREFDELLVKMLWSELSAPETATEPSRVVPEHRRWLKESLRILSGRDYAALGEEERWREWERVKPRWDGMGAEVKLAETMLRALRAILRGEKRASDVMFPGSSTALVEGVYRNNPLADYFNRTMAGFIGAYIEERKAGTDRSGLRLLELGAGTGGSSEAILHRLDALRGEVAEYWFTDVSRMFVLLGERNFGVGRDYLRYAVVDVEKGLDDQGPARGTCDVVVAANVLHATRRLRETLRNAKAALKTNGLLILNEITDKSVFMHLTFGLLPGWWAFEDEDLRMEGSPGLTVETWKRVLLEEGFHDVRFPAREAEGLGQQIIVAQSDGVIRRKSAIVEKIAKTQSPLAAAPVVENRRADLQVKIEAWLIEAIGVLLKVRPENVDLDVELSEFGFDSISLTGFANYVNQAYDLQLMPTVFFEHPTVRRFARYLAEKHAEQLAEKLTAERAPVTAISAATVRAAAETVPTALQEKIESWLVDAVGVLLKVKRENVDLDAELSEFGFDSISLTGFANHVNQTYGLELMPTVFFEYPTIRRFAAHLAQRHGRRLAEKLEITAAPAVQPPVRTVAPLPMEAPRPRDRGAEPVAIIGMSGRFPEADDLDAFWENLKAGKESVREIPRHRWDWRALEGHEQGGARWGAFMEGVDKFDPLFFGISPREAERMDPQHRLTLMYGWKAFEDAGYGTKQLWESRTGVFVGTTATGYSELLVSRDGSGIEGYTATGIVPSVGPNRLSFLLNLHGPSEPIETACSSSLVAVHRAVRSILSGECDMALAGGVNTLFPTLHMSFNKAGMLSPDGKCKTFSARADGYARGEGVGMIVLKRLSAAERDGDHIYGLIRGSAENHGGRAQSLTAPNPNAQAELIRDAYRNAGIDPRTVGYIEAHGTGTPLGDPIEINGLKSAFQSLYEDFAIPAAAGYCGLGSVKTNIGHLELAAGVAGLIKILLQMKHKTLVPTLHCDELNPYIQIEQSPFYIVRENQQWRRLRDEQGREWPLRAGISSFGFGGVNAHVVLEEYDGGNAFMSEVNGGPAVVVLSAKTGERLVEVARQLRDWIVRRNPADTELAAVAYTLQVGREAMDHRLAMVVGSFVELEARLREFADNGKSSGEGVHLGQVKRNSETLSLFRGDEELREAVHQWIRRGKWAKVLELWAQGLDVEWESLYAGVRPRRVSLPTYPFAEERCWIDTPVAAIGAIGTGAATAVLHPLLHRNTSDLSAQRYDSTFSGEELFLRDHRVRHHGVSRKLLPGVASLEMARAAVVQASPQRESGIVELRDVVWLEPVVVQEPKKLSITLVPADDGAIDYEIQGDAERDGARPTHCRGRAVFARADSFRLDIESLRGEMRDGEISASRFYEICAEAGLEYGPSHRGIVAIHLGEGQLLADLRLPDCVAADDRYFLHPSLMDSALQATIPLFLDRSHERSLPPVPFTLDSLRVFSACAKEMIVWVRLSSDREDARMPRIDIDLCDIEGRVCVELRGLASRRLEADSTSSQAGQTPAQCDHALTACTHFDEAFYRSLIADVANSTVSVEEAAELG